MTAKRDVKFAKNETTLERTTEREIVITRSFNAKPAIVFEAWTRPEFIRRWWAPQARNVSFVSCEADARVGGRYRYVLSHPEQGQFAFFGSYREVTPPLRLVYTENFEPAGQQVDEQNAAIVSVTFEEKAGQTLMTSRSLFPSKDILDMVLATGMEGGMRETLDQLDELVATLA